MFKSSSLIQYPGILAKKKKMFEIYLVYTAQFHSLQGILHPGEVSRREVMEAFNVAEMPP